MIAEEPATIAVPDGVTLEAKIAVSSPASGGIVICHPHPLYGGDMDNPVVVRIAEVASGLGWSTLRFNFRAVGRSTGAHGGGEAEQGDVLAAIDHLRARAGLPSRSIVLAGYSFGAAMSAKVGATSELAGLALIAPPLSITGLERLDGLASIATPLLIAAGSNDQYCPLPVLDRARTELPQATVHVIDGADHFFFGKLFPVGEVVREWLGRLQLGQA